MPPSSPEIRHRRAIWPACTASLVLAACGSSGASSPPPPGTDPAANFIATPSDFDQFHSWTQYPAAVAGNTPTGLHGSGPMTVYINKAPPKGSKSFPVSTIIVKETNEADVTARKVFAMVKTGGGYNPTGAVNWQWWELKNLSGDFAKPSWSGTAPPPGESYGGAGNGDCNGCHSAAKANDYVWDTPLQLSAFP